MSGNPLISVIIPCFNASAWIRETLDSVRAQDMEASQIEVIVVDDGSTDASAEVVRAAQAPGLRLIRTDNRGAAHARNVGTRAASGAFFQYLDADDLLSPSALRARREALEKSGADVVYGPFQRLVESGPGRYTLAEVVDQRIEQVNADTELAAFSCFWVPPVALMYRRRIVEKIGSWNEAYPVIQDARFLQDAAHCGASFMYLPGVGATYRVRSGSLARRSKLALEADILENSLDTERRWRRLNQLTPERAAYLAKSFRRSAEQLFWLDASRFRRAMEAFRSLSPAAAPSAFVSGCERLQRTCGEGVARVLARPVWLVWRLTGRLFRRCCPTGQQPGMTS